ncbi:hypothetical protein NPIL_456221, partial [Nephila pilipes]
VMRRRQPQVYEDACVEVARCDGIYNPLHMAEKVPSP